MGCELMRQMMHGLTLTVFAFAVATGAAAQDLTGEVAACAGISDATQRLACYDALAHRAEPTPKQMPAQLPAASELRLQEFGAEQIPRESDPAAQPDDDSITAGVSGVSVNSFGRFVLTLDNGQVWRQIDGDTMRLVSMSNSPRGNVTISRGLLGSYN